MRSLRLPAFATLIFALASGLHAQPASATFRPTLADEFSAGFTYSGKGDLDRGGAAAGEVALTRFDLSVAGRVPLSPDMVLIPGLAYSHTALDVSAGTFLPGSLQEFTLSLGLRGFVSKEWSYLAALRPGFYGDSSGFDSQSFNVPLFLAALYAPSPDLAWTFGVTVNAFNNHPVLPALGVRWKFAPDWLLEVGFPRTIVSRRIDDQLTVRAGLSVVGGSYRITENLGVPAPEISRLANTYLNVTEVRAGLGAVYQFRDGPVLEADLGVTTLRRFDYHDRNYRLSGDNVAWLSVALRQKF